MTRAPPPPPPRRKMNTQQTLQYLSNTSPHSNPFSDHSPGLERQLPSLSNTSPHSNPISEHSPKSQKPLARSTLNPSPPSNTQQTKVPQQPPPLPSTSQLLLAFSREQSSPPSAAQPPPTSCTPSTSSPTTQAAPQLTLSTPTQEPLSLPNQPLSATELADWKHSLKEMTEKWTSEDAPKTGAPGLGEESGKVHEHFSEQQPATTSTEETVNEEGVRGGELKGSEVTRQEIPPLSTSQPRNTPSTSLSNSAAHSQNKPLQPHHPPPDPHNFLNSYQLDIPSDPVELERRVREILERRGLGYLIKGRGLVQAQQGQDQDEAPPPQPQPQSQTPSHLQSQSPPHHHESPHELRDNTAHEALTDTAPKIEEVIRLGAQTTQAEASKIARRLEELSSLVDPHPASDSHQPKSLKPQPLSNAQKPNNQQPPAQHPLNQWHRLHMQILDSATCAPTDEDVVELRRLSREVDEMLDLDLGKYYPARQRREYIDSKRLAQGKAAERFTDMFLDGGGVQELSKTESKAFQATPDHTKISEVLRLAATTLEDEVSKLSEISSLDSGGVRELDSKATPDHTKISEVLRLAATTLEASVAKLVQESDFSSLDSEGRKEISKLESKASRATKPVPDYMKIEEVIRLGELMGKGKAAEMAEGRREGEGIRSVVYPLPTPQHQLPPPRPLKPQPRLPLPHAAHPAKPIHAYDELAEIDRLVRCLQEILKVLLKETVNPWEGVLENGGRAKGGEGQAEMRGEVALPAPQHQALHPLLQKTLNGQAINTELLKNGEIFRTSVGTGNSRVLSDEAPLECRSCWPDLPSGGRVEGGIVSSAGAGGAETGEKIASGEVASGAASAPANSSTGGTVADVGASETVTTSSKPIAKTTNTKPTTSVTKTTNKPNTTKNTTKPQTTTNSNTTKPNTTKPSPTKTTTKPNTTKSTSKPQTTTNSNTPNNTNKPNTTTKSNSIKTTNKSNTPKTTTQPQTKTPDSDDFPSNTEDFLFLAGLGIPFAVGCVCMVWWLVQWIMWMCE
ncbi:hypothetical protein GLAREA_09410 [Glarea lozoyensis ATCC 20868]|uniref:Uncharacterized protein n=1 Tax=Glarea lozoyensis (strain ATCC 20868 / MF5171) TaxID=1116229 RepID=S3CRM0_GLAL2|nr:uncharacterized protein GLAREA_09410 [Glarea lozoyensis ATCC 20868]EPE28290.1 hypothetical protein GLAREA_09410 [Glarea lozoyensis ATCC 20868]